MPVRHTALAVAVAMGFGFSGSVLAQSTNGTIFGQAPVAAGETVQIVGGSGFNRVVPVDKSGRYSVTLPVGTYDVTLIQDGKAVQTKTGVTAPAAGAVTVDFAAASGAANAQSLSSVMVTANAIPPIDVSSTQESTVITSEQLKNLPLARTGAAIALLAPGTVQGASALGGGKTGEPLVSFGGSSVAENAYYINGFNTSDPLGNSGGVTLPYGAIAQQETLTNGYGPEYGRSTGGVISQVGASGTNTWHFGGAIFWQPSGVQGTQSNLFYANPNTPAYDGKILDYRNSNSQWEQTYDAYVGGPLIKDKLFFFLAAEADRVDQQQVGPTTQPYEYNNHFTNPKYYAKVDWNITDSNILSLTDIRSSHQYDGTFYNYDYANRSEGDFAGYNQSTKNSFNIYVAKFTSYITDDLTLNALVGKMDGTYYTVQPDAPSAPNIFNQQNEDPSLCPSQACISNNNYANINNPLHKSENINVRFDLTYKLGDHTLQAGIDNQTTRDIQDGQLMTGPGYAWGYVTTTVGEPVVGTSPNVSPYVAPVNTPYQVEKYVYTTNSTVQVAQRAQYLKDTWQVTPNLLLNLGVRDEEFTNYNPDGEAYVRLTKPQWAPRLGFSWDILGDSSMKLFGNAGRYYLALPAGVALREAAASTYTAQYYTYSGITSTGIPTGLTPIPSLGQTAGPSVPVSANYEYGQPLDASTIASRNLGAEYQDSYVLGFQQQINPAWDYGVTGTWTKLGRIVDDTAEGPYTLCNALLAANPGLLNQPVSPLANCGPLFINGSILINPGSTNNYLVKNLNGGYVSGSLTPTQMGFPPAYRNYYSLEMFLEHPWDGKWTAKLDYVYSKSYGTTEGPVQSNIGQGSTSVSATTQWDFSQLMQYSNGIQANSRKHVLKGYGTYQFLPEWSVSGVLTLASGTPEQCMGYFGVAQTDPLGYTAAAPGAYHWCGGVPAPSGSTGYTPWLHTLDVALQYRPEWADKKLAFQLQIRNITNEQKLTQINPYYGQTSVPASQYKAAYILADGGAAVEAPRTIQLGVTYDW
ncbi:Oar protein [Dyella caseinilytica]|nr:Oar protein [Dyella caseinilytica]